MSAGAELPAPMIGVPQNRVGAIVQNFVSLDGVFDLDVRADPDGTFRIEPIR